MSTDAIKNLDEALAQAMSGRPKVGGVPYFAEVLRRAGIKRNHMYLPSCQSVYFSDSGTVVHQVQPLFEEKILVPDFDPKALVAIIEADKAGKTSFAEFLQGAWKAGVLDYSVDFEARSVTYRGAHGEDYVESYPAAKV